MAFWHRKKFDEDARALEARENLFLLLDQNMATHLGRQTFWRELHALDSEIEVGGLRMESYVPRLREMGEEDLSQQMFSKGMQTLVIPLKHRDAARAGAKMLNKIFAGCGTAFVAENMYRPDDGTWHFQIRSNIDKQHWDKLGVFCQYRFQREIPAEQQAGLMDECQQAVSDYTRGTPYEYWRPLEGVPAFVTLMGLHGLLRPTEKIKPDHKRKEVEFNKPHPRGTPMVFEGVQVHVELRGEQSKVVMTPYTFGYRAEKEALNDATAGKTYGELAMETIGGNPFDKRDGWTMRSIHSVALGLSLTGLATTLYAISHGAQWLSGDVGEMIGWVGPLTAAGAAGTFVVATYVDHKWKIIKRIENIRKGSQELAELEQQYAPQAALEHAMAPLPDRTSSLTVSVEEALPYLPSPIVQAVESAVKIDRSRGANPPMEAQTQR